MKYLYPPEGEEASNCLLCMSVAQGYQSVCLIRFTAPSPAKSVCVKPDNPQSVDKKLWLVCVIVRYFFLKLSQLTSLWKAITKLYYLKFIYTNVQSMHRLMNQCRSFILICWVRNKISYNMADHMGLSMSPRDHWCGAERGPIDEDPRDLRRAVIWSAVF